MSEEIIQRTFVNEDRMPQVENVNENHMACMFVLDVSGSMAGDPIDELNKGLNRFREEVTSDPVTRSTVDVGIIAFNNSMQKIQNFVPISCMEPVDLSASGGTTMTPALNEAISMVTERTRFYKRTGTVPYKPWIILVSDGLPQDDISAVAEKINQMELDGKMKIFALGVGDYDAYTLHLISGDKVMRLKDKDFTSFFDWIHKSLATVSCSVPGDHIKGVALPANIDKDTTDWMN